MLDKKHITGIILTGGKSSRMGSDKASLLLNGKPFVQYVAEALKPLVNTIVIVSSKPEHDQFGIPRIEDVLEDAGPLSGLYSGLTHSTTEHNLVLSCDIPFIKTETLALLLNEDDSSYDIVQLAAKGKSMPLIARYRKSCAPVCLKLLNSGERRLRKAHERFKVKTMIIEDDLAYQTQNINTLDHLNSISHEHSH